MDEFYLSFCFNHRKQIKHSSLDFASKSLALKVFKNHKGLVWLTPSLFNRFSLKFNLRQNIIANKNKGIGLQAILHPSSYCLKPIKKGAKFVGSHLIG